MRTKRPLLVTFIGDLVFLSAILGIISLFPTPKILEQFGVSFIPIDSISHGIIRLLEIICLLVIFYGFLKLKKWGYWTMISYNFFLLIISIISLITLNSELGTLFAGNFIPALLGLIITFPSKRYFIKAKFPQT